MKNVDNTLKKNDKLLVYLFWAFSAISLVCVIAFTALSEGRAFNDLLFGEDYFMDFYNSMCDAGTRDVYKERGVIYPPLSSLFFLLISKAVPHEYIALKYGNNERLQMYSDGLCQIVFVIFIVTVTLALGMLFYDILQRKLTKSESFLTAFFIMISFPMIYCIQRGNVALIAMVLSAFFVFYRSSENKIIRELSYVALALAAGFKIYPAIFGLLLITDKKYKEAIRLVIYGAAAFFLPFVFYGGFEGISIFIKNLITFSGGNIWAYSLIGPSILIDLKQMATVLGIDISLYLTIAKVVVWLMCAFIVFFANEEWKKLIGLFFAFVNIDSTARVYILIFLLISFVSYILQRSEGKINIIYGIMFCSLIITIPCFWYFKMDAITAFLQNTFNLKTVIIDLLRKPNVITEPFIILLFEIILTVETAVKLKHKAVKNRLSAQ